MRPTVRWSLIALSLVAAAAFGALIGNALAELDLVA